jgi:hypothetical protein
MFVPNARIVIVTSDLSALILVVPEQLGPPVCGVKEQELTGAMENHLVPAVKGLAVGQRIFQFTVA